MKAIYRRELDSQFNGLTGYVYCAFVLFVCGLFVMFINLQGSTQFEMSLYYMRIYFIPVISVPILTMRSIAEERRQKTDQLLYSLPLSMTEVVLGKYLALVTVLAVPMLVMLLYPVLLSAFASSGTIAYRAAYGAIIAYFFMCAAHAAICLFVSALTENVAVAAGLSVGAGLLVYMMNILANYVSDTAAASFIALTVVVLLIGLIFRLMTKNGSFSWGIALVLEAGLLIWFLVAKDSFSGLFVSIIEELALFGRFDSFANDIFDVTALVYYVTVAGLFLFLTVQSMEKRRWS